MVYTYEEVKSERHPNYSLNEIWDEIVGFYGHIYTNGRVDIIKPADPPPQSETEMERLKRERNHLLSMLSERPYTESQKWRRKLQNNQAEMDKIKRRHARQNNR